MFYYVRGTLAVCELSTAVIDCGGVGYKLFVSDTTFSKIAGKTGQEVKLFTHLCVREDAVELMGFFTNEELSAFKMLITVSGVGPRAAMAILSIMTPDKLAVAVSAGDVKSIARANGVGKKTAERVILELKDKMSAEFASIDEDTGEVISPLAPSKNHSEAVSALTVLGFTRSEAEWALAGSNSEDTLENLINAALKKLATRI